MLSFFRKHQKILFIFVTIIIVTSFVFFGTYQAFAPGLTPKEEEAFTTCNGKKITKSYFQDLSRFLATEPLSFKGFSNFFNDQIITKDFLDANLYQLIVKKDEENIRADLRTRLTKEKQFRPYRHPYLKDLTAENIWGTFAPHLKEAFNQYKQLGDGGSDVALENRVALFLFERRFPGEILAYILRHQEKEYEGVPQDRRLAESMNLFGYKDLNDWFGTHFVDGAAKALIEGAAFATKSGYSVSKDEVIAEIAYRKEKAFQMMKGRYDNSYLLYQDTLRALGIDEMRLMAIMEDVLLFRKVFNDVSSINCVDTFAMKQFYNVARECVEVEVVKLPQELLFNNKDDLKKFEFYLQMTTEPTGSLSLGEPLSLDVVNQRASNLVASEFKVAMSHVSKKELEGRVSVKATWEWEKNHKDILAKQFPRINLDQPDSDDQQILDQFARGKIVSEHSDWVLEALSSKEKEEKALSFPLQSLEGIENPSELIGRLEKDDAVILFSQDGENFYSFDVKERSKRVLSFKEAMETKSLDHSSLSDSKIENLYRDIYSYAAKEGLVKGSFEAEKENLPMLRCAHMLKSDDKSKVTTREKIYRHSTSLFSFYQVCQAEKGVCVSEKLGPCVYKVIDRRIENPLPFDKMLLEEKLVSDELKGHLLNCILNGNSPS